MFCNRTDKLAWDSLVLVVLSQVIKWSTLDSGCMNFSGVLKQSVTYRYREFSLFFVVSVSVSEKIGTGKKSRYRYRKNLVPEKSIGIGKIWYRKKVSISEIFGKGKRKKG